MDEPYKLSDEQRDKIAELLNLPPSSEIDESESEIDESEREIDENGPDVFDQIETSVGVYLHVLKGDREKAELKPSELKRLYKKASERIAKIEPELERLEDELSKLEPYYLGDLNAYEQTRTAATAFRDVRENLDRTLQKGKVKRGRPKQNRALEWLVVELADIYECNVPESPQGQKRKRSASYTRDPGPNEIKGVFPNLIRAALPRDQTPSDSQIESIIKKVLPPKDNNGRK